MIAQKWYCRKAYETEIADLVGYWSIGCSRNFQFHFLGCDLQNVWLVKFTCTSISHDTNGKQIISIKSRLYFFKLWWYIQCQVYLCIEPLDLKYKFTTSKADALVYFTASKTYSWILKSQVNLKLSSDIQLCNRDNNIVAEVTVDIFQRMHTHIHHGHHWHLIKLSSTPMEIFFSFFLFPCLWYISDAITHIFVWYFSLDIYVCWSSTEMYYRWFLIYGTSFDSFETKTGHLF